MTMQFESSAPIPFDSGERNLWARLQTAMKKGIVGFFRQSTVRQARLNLGSQQVQEEQMHYLAPFGITAQDVTVVLAYGESGKAGVVRAKFEELKLLIRRGKVGLVLLARHDRLGRNTTDSSIAYDLMREHGVLIMVDGRLYDPGDPADDFVLRIYAQFAEYENRTRTRWLLLAKYATARRGELRIPLPCGFVWADPTDPAFIEATKAAGLESWLDVSAHRVSCRVEDATHYVLPYPSRELHTAMKLMCRWALEGGTTTRVRNRINAGEGEWPKPGKVPRQPSRYFWSPDQTVTWVTATDRRIYEVLRSPALSGTYQYQAPSLVPVGLRTPIGSGEVEG